MHYTLLVFGDDIEEQMMPFCEDISVVIEAEQKRYQERREKDPNASTEPIYLKRNDVTQELRSAYQKSMQWRREKKEEVYPFTDYISDYYGEIKYILRSSLATTPEIEIKEKLNPKTCKMEWIWDLRHGHYFAILNDETYEIEQIINYEGPRKWDWYVIGGRWRWFFPIKTLERLSFYRYSDSVNLEAQEEQFRLQSLLQKLNLAEEKENEKRHDNLDSAFIKDIDFNKMREEGRKIGYNHWDNFHKALADRPLKTFTEWLKECNNDYQAAQLKYRNDPAAKDIDALGLWLTEEDIQHFLTMSREAYGDFQAKQAICTYAALFNEKWEEREGWELGRGFFDNFTRDQWAEHLEQLIASVSPETRLTLIDYHT